MNKKFSRILGVGLTVAVLASLLVVGAPASASELSWGSVSAVDDLKAGTGNIIATDNISIVDMAINGNTIYGLTTGNTSRPLVKSTDGGTTWSNLYSSSSFPAGNTTKAIAVAPDNANTVAFIANNGTADNIFYSSNGGTSWTNVGTPATGATITSIDVAPGGSVIAVGGNDGTDAELYTLSLAIAQTWQPRVSGAFAAGQTSVGAVKFSPNYSTDKIITVVTGSATNATFQAFRNESGAYTWNGGITWFVGWGTGVDLGPITTALAKASIALPATYLGTNADLRLAFVGYAGTTTGGGAVRLSDNFLKNFQTWNAGDEGKIGSVAYNESGILLAGKYDSNTVYRATTPMASSPSFEKLNAEKQPGGTDKTLVAWIGTSAIAVTAGDESAFSVSTDNGNAFNDASLINTAISVLNDVALQPAGTKYYLTSTDNREGTGAFDTSVWYYDGSKFLRVMSRKNQADANSAFMVRSAPDDNAAVYVIASGTNNIWVSKDSGTAKWTTALTVYKLAVVKDFVVKSANVLYAIDNAANVGLSVSSDGGNIWSTKVNSVDAITGNMISLAPNGDVLIGGTDGYVAFSKDNAATLTRTKQVATSGNLNVQVTAASDYATSGNIFAAAGANVKRGKADATSSWSSLNPSTSNGPAAISGNVSGIAVDNVTGALYVVSTNTSDSELFRSLSANAGSSTTADLWSKVNSTGLYSSAPSALKISTGNVLWAINTEDATLASFGDTIVAKAPTLKSPTAGFTVKVNPGTGEAYNVAFSFDRQNSKVTSVDLQIAQDSAFTGIVYEKTFAGLTSTTTTKIIGPTSQEIAQFLPSTTYYTRIRTSQGGPVYSPWSATVSFVIASSTTFGVTGPETGAVNVPVTPTFVWTPYEGAIGYEVVVATDPSFSIIEFSHSTTNTFYKVEDSEKLDNSTTYYFRVRGVTGPAPANKPAPGGPWSISVFTTEALPATTPTGGVQPTIVLPTTTQIVPTVITVPIETPAAIPSYLLWAIIVIGAVLVIALIVLIVRTRRVA